MLRITQHQSAADTAHLIVEGRLMGAWVEELKAAWIIARSSAASVQLDLAGVHFVDEAGLVLLRGLLDQGGILHDASAFVRELLKKDA